MANASLSSSENPHFFQPLLPGFKNNLKIPVKFFSGHIEGKHEGQTVNLISDSSEKTWKVKMEGHRLTEGWKEFVEAHELQISDFVVCRHEGDMLFHVTAFGPSCCEIQYEEESDESESSREEEEENVITESDYSSSDLNSFSQSVTASNLSRDTVTVPMNFARRSCLSEGRHEVVLMNEEGGSWASELKSSSQVKIIRGWTSFCNGNRLEVGDSCTFKLLQNTEKPVFRLYNRTKAERKKEVLSEEDNIVDKSRANRLVNLTLTPNSLELGKQHLPVSFTRVNMLNKPGEIILVDKNGNEWSMGLKAENRSGMYIMGGNGWKKFCSANEVGVGDYLTLELIQGGTTSPLLKFCSQMKQSPSEAEALVNKRARVQRWSQETRPKLEIRENTEDGETSHRPRASTKSIADHGDLLHTQPCSVSDQVVKVKQSVVDTLTSIRRFLAELKTMEEKLGDSLQEINKLEEEVQDNRNKTTSSSDDQV